jgi:small basic protein (TIGR04137 family)
LDRGLLSAIIGDILSSSEVAREARGIAVSMDRSLKRGSRLVRSRNVLKREERIAFLKSEDRWSASAIPFGLPKIRVVKTTIGKKKKKKTEGEGDAAAAPGDAKAPAKAAAKAAAPAKGGKK